jgi:hypothetical protein
MTPDSPSVQPTGSGNVEPVTRRPGARKRKRSPSDERRRARRAVEATERTAQEIQQLARERQSVWRDATSVDDPALTANATRKLTRRLDEKYVALRATRTAVCNAADVIEGQQFERRKPGVI